MTPLPDGGAVIAHIRAQEPPQVVAPVFCRVGPATGEDHTYVVDEVAGPVR